MQECTIPYIPPRLRTEKRLPIEKFEIGECLYMRCSQNVLENPYTGITIVELSHNRSGINGIIFCNPDDVLYSIKQDEPFEKYLEKVVCTLDIMSLDEHSKFRKVYNETTTKGVKYEGVLELLHEPEPCMYPHCIFRVWINNEKVTYPNYNETLKKAHQIRNRIKEELASMIRKGQVNYDNNPAV